MPNSNVVASDLIVPRVTRARRDHTSTEHTDPTAPVPTGSGVRAVSSADHLVREVRAFSRGWSLTDGQVLLLVGAALFVLGAWPLALTEVPPYQDLPNHLAAATVIDNPARYPEFVFNGFFKTNAALFAWLFVVGKVAGVKLAARLFALMVLAANAFVFPRFILEITGSRKRVLVASLFLLPMIHNWFVSMGMLDFALAVPLSLELLLAADRQRKKPSLANAALVTALGGATWYAHVFPVLVVCLLVLIESARGKTWAGRFASLRAMGLPLLPVVGLVFMSIFEQLRDSVGSFSMVVAHGKMAPPWELFYNLWAEWFWGFTKLSITSLVPTFLLAYYGFTRRRESPTFFSPAAVVVMALLFCLAPYRITNWYHVNSRLIPFLWMAMLVRLPEHLPRRVIAVLGVAGVLYSAGMGADFIRLDEDRARFTAGINTVPEGARLLPLVFKHKGASDNTRSLLHAWGYYVTDRYTSAPLLFAHSRSFPVSYKAMPPVRFNDLVLENFAAAMATSATFCESSRVVTNDCRAEYRARWAEFWHDATPLYDHVLLWEPSEEALSLVPIDYGITFRQGGLVIMERGSNVPSVSSPAPEAPAHELTPTTTTR